jgi:undecaprenyl-phosphate 4-deoxy-4-formamido-L-arabinose transferase
VNPDIELSFVIPVFNGSLTIASVVEQIHAAYGDLAFEIVLVNDGSADASEATCRALADRYPDTVTFVHLARNFGEHNAVLAGLNQATGAHVAVLDDDGQNPPGEVRRMLEELVRGGYDVVYGAYREKRHSGFRNLGSAFNDWVARIMLKKPADLYLSSFKVMNRFIVNEVIRYRGAFRTSTG